MSAGEITIDDSATDPINGGYSYLVDLAESY